MSACSIDGCDRPAYAHGLCKDLHYARWRRWGDPLLARHPIAHSDPEERFWAKVNKDGPLPVACPELGACWPWTAYCTEDGYGVLAFGKRGQTILAHRFAFTVQIGPIPPDGDERILVLHRCDNPPCQRETHLYLGDDQANSDDREGRGRGGQPHGERNGVAKLTDEIVRSIRLRYAAGGISQQRLADELGVNQTIISDVVRRETWRHVE